MKNFSKKKLMLVIVAAAGVLVGALMFGSCGSCISCKPAGHVHDYTYDTVVYDPTCTEGGYTEHICSCGDAMRDNETPAKGHTPGDTVVDEEPTCLTAGKSHVECVDCHAVISTRVLPRTEDHKAIEGEWTAKRGDESQSSNVTLVKSTVCDVCKKILSEETYTVTLIPQTFSYDGNEHSLTVAGLPGIFTVEYSGNNQKAAGVHTVTATVLFDGAPVENANISADLTIEKDGNYHDVTFIFEDSSKNYTIVVENGRPVPTENLPEVEQRTGYNALGGFDESSLIDKDTEIHVTYVAIEYNITYYLLSPDEVTNDKNPTKYTIEDNVELKAAVRKGYTFIGWYAELERENLVTSIAAGSTGDKEFYAKWEATVYSITYELDGGVTVGNLPETYTYDGGIGIIEDPTKDYFEFGGWFTDSAFGTPAEFGKRTVTGNITLYAKWTAVTYSITYDLGGGENSNENPSYYTAESETIVLKPAAKTGYNFVGWYDRSGRVDSIESGSHGNVELTAKWSAIVYSINYFTDGGENSPSNPGSYTIESGTITLEPATKAGYTFMGWYGNKGLTGKIVTEISGGSYGTRDLYAAWEVIVYSITYEYNGGTVFGVNRSTYTVEDEVTLIKPSRDHYAFAGWTGTDIPDGYYKADVVIAKGSTGNREYAANWQATRYSIEYILGKSDATNPDTNPLYYTIESETITLVAAESDHEFGGWYTDYAHNNQITEIRKGSFGNLRLYAAWVHVPAGEWIETKQPTCSVVGEKHRVCGICGEPCEWGEIELNPDNHTKGKATHENVVESTCTVGGSYDEVYYCTGCGKELERTKVAADPLGHDFNEETGICSRCGAEISRNLGYTKINGGYVVYYNTCTDTDVVIPSTYQGEPVIQIGSFKDKTKIRSVTLPDTIISIENQAFFNCSALTTINIPDSVTTIGRQAFAGCGFTTIDLPVGLKTIGSGAFHGCKNLTEIKIPYGITEISSECFKNCANLVNVDIPSSVVTIGDYAFNYCVKLENVVIPYGVKRISDYAFYRCVRGSYPDGGGLKTVVISDSVEYIGRGAFSYNYYLESVTLGKGVTEMNYEVFKNCNNLSTFVWNAENCTINAGGTLFDEYNKLTDLTFGNTVKTIPSFAFRNCFLLENIVIPDSVITVGCQVFDDTAWYKAQPDNEIAYLGDVAYRYKSSEKIPAVTSAEVKAGTRVLAGYLFYKCENLTSVTLPAGLQSISYMAFYQCSALESVELPETVAYIDRSAFGFCEALKEITIPVGVGYIEKDAFTNCTALTTVNWNAEDCKTDMGISKKGVFTNCTNFTVLNIGANVKVIPSGVFADCTALKSVVIPYGVTTIEKYAFSGCTGLTNIEFSETVAVIGDNAFENCSAVKKVVLPDSIESVGIYSFMGCSALADINLSDDLKIGWGALSGTEWFNNQSDGVIYIGTRAYDFKGSATEVITVKDGTTEIMDMALSYVGYACKKIVIPEGVTKIGADAFRENFGLTTIVLPSTLTVIGANAFISCSALTDIVIPENVTFIGDKAFSGCSALTSIVIPDKVTYIGSGAFRGCSQLKNIVIPSSATEIGDGAFEYCNALTAIYAKGDGKQIERLEELTGNLASAVVYAYSKEEPETEEDGSAYVGNYWHFDEDGVTPVIWKKQQ